MASGPSRRPPWWPILFLCASIVVIYLVSGRPVETFSYSKFRDELAAGHVEKVTISRDRIEGTLSSAPPGGARGFRIVRVDDETLLADLRAAKVEVTGAREGDLLGSVLSWGLPLAMILFFLWSLRSLRGGAAGPMAVGRSNAKLYVEKEVKVRFGDVAGVDEAKEELREVIDFLQTPARFERLGGVLPRGILLVGPPGTGKTLLARAVAGEAGVPFFSISGSAFVEMFVGVGAARVRDLFTQAKEKAPCIIFIDELDAIGKARGVATGSHEEREQTLNQLLVELDGFDPRVGVVLMAATNRPEILDPALLRAGRFDRHVLVDRPDKAGRLAILRVHAARVALSADADLERLAAISAGMVGADLANIVNEAALLAVRRDKAGVGMAELEDAVERVIAGLEKRNRILIRAEKERVAHHELGHALIALALPSQGPVQKISIVPRGVSTLGYTMQLPTEDRFLMTQGELEDKIAVLLGGRVAEELIYGEVSTGAQDDLLKATNIARSMVKSYAMSHRLGSLGHLSFESERASPFLEPAVAASRGDYSEAVAQTIDAEMRRIVDQQYLRARQLLEARLPLLRHAAQALLASETLTGDALARMTVSLPAPTSTALELVRHASST
jgi:cell division protease FtsH